jgi:hypothetical protein
LIWLLLLLLQSSSVCCLSLSSRASLP